MAVYSFKSIVAGLVGPGAVINLGDGASVAEEGLEVTAAGDKSAMTIGADGDGFHSLYGDRSGVVAVTLLKTSPMNAVLSAAYALQTSNPASHGQNTISIVDKLRGDVVVAQQCAFKKAPDLKYAKDGGFVRWEFDAIKIDRTLG